MEPRFLTCNVTQNNLKLLMFLYPISRYSVSFFFFFFPGEEGAGV